MPRCENLSEDQISKWLLELNEEWEEDSSDSYYCSEDCGLTRKLLSKNTRSAGANRKSKVEPPSAFTNGKEREINSIIFGFQMASMVLCYCPKKNYALTHMSTMYSQPSIDSKSAEKKPEVNRRYNKRKGGVDTVDKMRDCIQISPVRFDKDKPYYDDINTLVIFYA
ncbi:Hypothetical predicted protein [Octopus vulgaris]|uniref:PiggyBac transposable element-derived protein domain-containing protein n=1 Tax=Octopus vulgaris TaxID=6645 RepID=A0AA36BA64_OCTVU|nr:Hypothetical predicted protein [Octopus vulgaris]